MPADIIAPTIRLERASEAAYPSPGSKSASLYGRALKSLPGGNSRITVFHSPYPLYATRASGSRIWDADGVERIDFINNLSSLVHGHSHPRIVEAIQSQAAKLASVSMPTEREIELAEILTGRVAGIERVRFANSGTEGVMIAVRAARAYTGRSTIAKVEGAYHGSFDAVAVSVSPVPDKWGTEDRPATFAPPGVGRGAASDTIILPMNDVDAARAILREHADRLAAVILDPVVKNLGYRPMRFDFAKMIREETTRAGALLIFDEVYSFRAGYHGAQGELGVTPDLTALGKLIGGGLPVGAVGGRADVMDAVFDPRKNGPQVSHGGTFNANPLTMAAGIAAMELWDAPAVARLARLGERLRAGLREAFAVARAPGTVTGVASMTALYHGDHDGEIETYRDVVRMAERNPQMRARCDRFFHHLLGAGILMAPQGYFVLSTAHDESEIDFLIEQALGALRKIH